ncbi:MULTISPECIES: YciI family protein [unclassified Streptomyces]|uniref:YciI family protein n=1 Tax=unclassified Streptomyces TaxID=2593676 RepID=UPI000DAB44C4|nr:MULTISPECIES: YciI family protein [unclassified Streptomyces]PZT72572.1 YciI family protein [Streptomyces sp. AC1-42T]PZT81110.1 YciI family protein [Streptomyces sp. AC1-42W]
MLWAIHCVDAPGSAELRAAQRPAHSARLRAASVRPVLYGPLTAEDGTTAVGSLIVIEAADRAEAEEFATGDPFAVSGVWERVDVRAFVPSERSPVRIGTDTP